MSWIFRGMRRFYQKASVTASPSGFAIALDGKLVKTPGKRVVSLESRPLALAVAEEWESQTPEIVPAAMPLMKLAATAIDRVTAARADVIENAATYAASDLLCYRADSPPELAARQAAAWQPLVEWASSRFDAPLEVTTGITAIPQPMSSLCRLREVLEAVDVMSLTAIADLTGLMGSLVLALAIWDQRLDAAAACDAALLDEAFQSERWGVDEEAALRLRNIRAEISAAARFMALHRAGLE